MLSCNRVGFSIRSILSNSGLCCWDQMHVACSGHTITEVMRYHLVLKKSLTSSTVNQYIRTVIQYNDHFVGFLLGNSFRKHEKFRVTQKV